MLGSDKEAPCRLGAWGFGGCLTAVSSSALATYTDRPGHSVDSLGLVQTTRHGLTPGVSHLLQVPQWTSAAWRHIDASNKRHTVMVWSTLSTYHAI